MAAQRPARTPGHQATALTKQIGTPLNSSSAPAESAFGGAKHHKRMHHLGTVARDGR